MCMPLSALLQLVWITALCFKSCPLQTAWRGFHVRETHPRRKQLADIRLRLAAAAVNAGGCSQPTGDVPPALLRIKGLWTA